MGWDSDSDDDKFNYDEEDYDDGFTKKKDRFAPYTIARLLTRPPITFSLLLAHFQSLVHSSIIACYN